MARFLFYDEMIINLFVKREKPSGGAAVQALGWIRGLLDAGEEVQVLTDLSNVTDVREEYADITLVPLYDKEKGLRWLRWLYYRLPYIYRVFKQSKPDYFYEGVPNWKSFVFGLICRRLKIKYILRISNDCLLDERVYKSRSRIHAYFQQLGMKLAYCILCQNEYQHSIVQSKFPGKKTMKIANPVLLPKATIPKEEERQGYIAWLGTFQYQKNLPLLFEIAKLLENESFLIAGKEHPSCDPGTLHALSQLRLLPNVRFTGFLERKDILPYLSKAKYLLNTSHYEGFSNTFLEAMSVATPVITSSRVNPDEIISKHELGIVYNDAVDLKVKFSAVTPETYKFLSTNAGEYIGRHDYRLLSRELFDMLSDCKTTYALQPV